MRQLLRVLKYVLMFCVVAAAAVNEDFSGDWRLDRSRSDIRNLPPPADAFVRVQMKPNELVLSFGRDQKGPFTTYIYPLDGSEAKNRAGTAAMSTLTKWEGSALLVNTLVSGTQSYTVMERWNRS